ncbi:MAG: RNA methyltransferase [Bacteroidales bacterium]|nr:RNA methyltransferase [Bacteroidales bacterium]MCF8404074.1 RNA methyltransferase [Bacteroidales bacterium]
MLSKNKEKIIRSLPILKYRKQTGLFLAEGPKIVEELLESTFEVNFICATSEWLNSKNSLVKKYECFEVTQNELNKISALKNPNQVLATFKIPDNSPIPNFSNELILVLDNIRDPGNLGTIIRSADWFGVKNIICANTCVDLYNPKVVQSTMGSIARVGLFYTDLIEYFTKAALQMPVYGAVLNGANMYTAVDTSTGYLIIGNESNGISDGLLPFITKKLSIPSFVKPDGSHAESLNASVATAVLLAEFKRKEHSN